MHTLCTSCATACITRRATLESRPMALCDSVTQLFSQVPKVKSVRVHGKALRDDETTNKGAWWEPPWDWPRSRHEKAVFDP